MLTFIKIAIRNIIRNKKRSLITISAVGFGLGALIFIWCFVEGAHKQMIDNYTSYLTSPVEIYKQGFHQKNNLETNIKNASSLLPVLKNHAGIASFAQRVRADGLVSSSEASSGVLILGIDPKTETHVSTFAQRIKTGSFLTAGSDKDIVIGIMLAKNLNVGLDDKIVIMSQALDGSIAAGAYYVRGLLDTGVDEIDKGIVMITLPAAQELFVMENKISEIAIKLKSAIKAKTVTAQLKEQLPAKDLEILTWAEISPTMKQWIEFDNTFVGIIVFVVMIVVAIGILNTVLMGVLERTREFGILIALGTKQKEIIAMVTWESIFLGLIGTAFGLLLGLGLSFYFGKIGIDLSIFTSALNSFYMDAVIYPIVNGLAVAGCLVMVLFISILVSIYPAWHAAKLKPVEAIRTI